METHRAVNGSVKFAEVEENDVRVAGDTQQSTIDTEVYAMHGERAVVVVIEASLRLVEQLRRLQLVQHVQTHCKNTINVTISSVTSRQETFSKP